MESVRPRLRLGRIINRSNLFQTIAFVFCVLFGLALTANIEPAGDGVWFWYSFFLHSGIHLYADMHLALQPLYVLETSAFMGVLGKGWLVSKIPAVLHLVAYCLALLLLVRQSNLSDARKAILLACSFFVSIGFGAIVFGDYHVLADCFVALLGGSPSVAQNVVQRWSHPGTGGDPWPALRSGPDHPAQRWRCAVRWCLPRYRVPGSFEETAVAAAVLSDHRLDRPARRVPDRGLPARLCHVFDFQGGRDQGRWRHCIGATVAASLEYRRMAES